MEANSKTGPGAFVISLDFELYWGLRDKRSIEEYRENLDGVRNAVEKMLEMFTSYGIHATWATVGLIYFKNVAELNQHLPGIQPEYKNESLSPYKYLKQSENIDDHYHFAPDLIERIRNTPGQEIGTHTFSHYYCLEEGQTAESFKADMQAAIKTAAERGIKTDSLVFPRNQWNPEYLPILDELGIKCYRGCENSWLHKAVNQQGESKLRRALRLVDAYVNLTGHHTYPVEACVRGRPFNIPASRFLRPYNRKQAFLDGLKLRRIKKAMTHAATTGQVFHLWWHPHNLGTSTGQNLRLLVKVLDHYSKLEEKYSFESARMAEVA